MFVKPGADAPVRLNYARYTRIARNNHRAPVFNSAKYIHCKMLHRGATVKIPRVIGLAYNYFREVFADVKALWDLIFSRQPKYLGSVIPITGDGTLNP